MNAIKARAELSLLVRLRRRAYPQESKAEAKAAVLEERPDLVRPTYPRKKK